GMTNVYRLTLRYQGKAHTLHVIHALNWPDHGALPRTDDLRQLAQLVNQYQSGSPESSVPMIHCLGGVGRTGTLAAATLLLKAPNIDLDRVVDEFRDARNERMLEDYVQRGQLKALQQELTSSR
ncbi:protein-tyrosine phosphatase family protein, partial [Escherichia coli]|uniref:protein-tyrosine phosphatase family protein n=1 Tax=Escherichia coli TaxID=562 RepID=UPI00137CCEFB